MRPTLVSRLKIRSVDWLLGLAVRPNRVDPRATVAPSARVTASEIHGPVQIAEHATVHRAHLEGSVKIGANSSLWGPDIYVYTKTTPIEIGNFCSVARGVSIHGYFHDATRVSTYFIGRNVLGRQIEDEIITRGRILIGHDVWIGSGVHIMSGVQIGTGAIIGAGSVVTKNVPPYAVSVGCPARVVRYRFNEDIIKRLESSQWWMWSHEEIKEKAPLFSSPVTAALLDEQL